MEWITGVNVTYQNLFKDFSVFNCLFVFHFLFFEIIRIIVDQLIIFEDVDYWNLPQMIFAINIIWCNHRRWIIIILDSVKGILQNKLLRLWSLDKTNVDLVLLYYDLIFTCYLVLYFNYCSLHAKLNHSTVRTSPIVYKNSKMCNTNLAKC